MIKLSDIYALPSKPVALTEWVLREDWFRELAFVSSIRNHEALQTMERQGRLEVREIHCENIDNLGRHNALRVLVFDKVPVAVVFNGGRDGDDVRRRWITNQPVYVQLLGYLIAMEPDTDESEADGYADPEALRYEEEIFDCMGGEVAATLGFPYEARVQGYSLAENRRGRLFSPESAEAVLLFARKGAPEPAEYVRRGPCVMKRNRLIPRSELQLHNIRIDQGNEQDGVDRTYVYMPCEMPTGDVTIVSL